MVLSEWSFGTGTITQAELTSSWTSREMGGAPRNPARGNQLLVWIVKSISCHCTDGHLTSRAFAEC